jgi:hypothetical protein
MPIKQLREKLNNKICTFVVHLDVMYTVQPLKVHKNENLFGFDFEFCPISLLVMHK